MKSIAVFLLTFYRKLISPALVIFFGISCRFSPTCSEYALIAIRKFGFAKGSFLAVKRLSKCHPFSGVNPDPLPSEIS